MPRKRRTGQLAFAFPADPVMAQALRDARDILEWRTGPNPMPWQIQRLAQALVEQDKRNA